MAILDVLFGRPLPSDADSREKIGVAAGVPIFGLDALGSAAYGPEAALTILLPLGAAGLSYIVPISGLIILLLAIVYFSYRQTIDAYPGGGGSYTVASENLGARVGLFAAASLIVDYILVVAVGISAGIGALVSAVPKLQPHTLALCLVVLAVLTVLNLRGVREAGVIFMMPTYVFVLTLGSAVLWGLFQALTHGGHVEAVIAPARLAATNSAAFTWFLVKAFASGCTAMTGVEAVSNGVNSFREPVSQTAKRTLTLIVAILASLLAGIAYLCRVYQVGATEPGGSNYQSVLSQLIAAIAGKGWFYYITIGAILIVLALSANTAFAGFPRLAKVVAQNGYLPNFFRLRGRRLVYSQGVYLLTILSGILLVIFGGVTDRLIPLFAIGALLSFTASQAGMVVHWRKTGGAGSKRSMAINAIGATATGITAVIVLVAKFTEGAWVVLLLIPALIVLMSGVRRHYAFVRRETQKVIATAELGPIQEPIVVLPLEQWNRIAEKAIRFAMSMTKQVQAVHVQCEDTEDLRKKWNEFVTQPALHSGLTPPELVTITSPYRFVMSPIVDHVVKIERDNPDRQIAVLVPELVERHWWHQLLHNQRSEMLRALLLWQGQKRIVVITIPWFLHD